MQSSASHPGPGSSEAHPAWPSFFLSGFDGYKGGTPASGGSCTDHIRPSSRGYCAELRDCGRQPGGARAPGHEGSSLPVIFQSTASDPQPLLGRNRYLEDDGPGEPQPLLGGTRRSSLTRLLSGRSQPATEISCRCFRSGKTTRGTTANRVSCPSPTQHGEAAPPPAATVVMGVKWQQMERR